MKSRTLLLLATFPAVLIFVGPAESKMTGILPNTVVGTVNVGSLTRVSTRTCGQCHATSSGVGGVRVTVAPTTRVMPAGASTAVTISGSSSIPSTTGGFCADVTKGTLVPGANTRINAAGTAITHVGPSSRSWSFNWKAPMTPGLAELYTAVNCTNGNLLNTGDAHSFHGSSPTSTVSTPVRLYANAPGVKATGTSCSDGYGNFSVLGAPVSPTVGNSAFRLEGFGLPPASGLLLMVRLGGNVPGFDMKPLGAPGCVLRTAIQIQAVAGTTAGDPSRAEGTFIVPMAIPNQNALRGLTLSAQYGETVSDTVNGVRHRCAAQSVPSVFHERADLRKN